MDARDVYRTIFDSIAETVDRTVGGLSADQVNQQPLGEANSIAWLIWHLTRVQDDHLADAFDHRQVWPQRWSTELALGLPEGDTGYGHSADEVAQVQVTSVDQLIGYHRDVHRQTLVDLESLTPESLDEVIDERWDPPVTRGVRLASVVGDCYQHLGQAGFVRGLLPHL
ncbi:DinB family protein [Tersicoccus sp. MR15.9]|uniref:mycothiol transferase n=1 Tax=Tersicoccus mangrovi TaxID=3121635 RepID=UPI002FE515AB